MNLFAVAVAMATFATGCSSPDTPASSSSSSSGGSSSGDADDAGAAGDAASNGDAAANTNTDSGGNAGACQPTGGLTVPASGAAITATFSEPVGFNGGTAPFTSAGPGVAVKNVNESRVSAGNFTMPKFGERNQQTISVVFETAPTACKTYTTLNTPTAGGPAIILTDNAQGQWWCGGTLVIDTVDGLAITFHFDTVCKANPVGNTSTGTVHLAGKGAATLIVN